MAGENSGGELAHRPRSLGFEAEGGMAGLSGSGWEAVVGEGRGRAGTSGRASRRAAATLTLIRCRVTKWRIGPQWPPPSSAAGKEREIGRTKEELAWQKMPQMAWNLRARCFSCSSVRACVGLTDLRRRDFNCQHSVENKILKSLLLCNIF